MDYEKLSEIYRKELSNPDIVEVDVNFYEELRKLLQKKKEQIKEDDYLSQTEYWNTKKMIDRIINLRVTKIVDAALKGVEVNITPEESLLYSEVKNALEQFRKKVDPSVKDSVTENIADKDEEKQPTLNIEKSKVELEEQTKEIRENEIKKESTQKFAEKSHVKENEEDTIKIKITRYVERYLGTDGNIYGPYNVGDVVKITKIEGEWLIENGFAQKIE